MSKCPDQFFWRVGIHRFHQYSVWYIDFLSFAAGGLDEGDNANCSVQHIFGSTSCATVAAGCEGLLSKPVLHDSTIEVHESIGSATLVAAMYQKCILQLYTDDTHVSGVPVLVSTTDGSKCHCSSGFNVSWQGFGRCIAGLGLNKHSSKAWFCVQAGSSDFDLQ